MNNKTDIEEDIEIVEDTIRNYNITGEFKNPSYEDLDNISIAIENILADRERLGKENNTLAIENFRLNTELQINRKEYQDTYKDVREELKELQAKANKYDSLVEKMKEMRRNLNKDGFIGYADEITDILEELKGE